MSRSYKKNNIIKERPRNKKKSSLYWRIIRRVWKYTIKSGNFDLKDKRLIVNDYDYCDFIIRHNLDKKYKRK